MGSSAMDPEANYATLHEEISKLLERLQAVHEQELGRRRRLRPRKKVTSKVRLEAQRGSEDELHEAQVEVRDLVLSSFSVRRWCRCVEVRSRALFRWPAR